MFYQIIKVGKEEIGLVWSDQSGKPQAEFIYLPGREKMSDRIIRDFPSVGKTPRRAAGLDRLIADLYEGQKTPSAFSALNRDRLAGFSAEVLQQTCRIPRGKVATYSGLAKRVGHPGAARAVGTVMANNPFPIIVPCHRVVRADGSVGRFGGGSAMKKELLEKEGVLFDARGRVRRDCIIG
ncbi:MAG: MGMT family protein [Deltaproteobacteria bacterium]|jgi:methylated-DNA-[protein]-cysteine S-methyltransferase|nr:MGMT family protein [Syntrophaceae bacterium]